MKYSIKPFLLDSILTWANANRCTPILTAKAHTFNKIPDELSNETRLSFNLSQKLVARKVISTQGILFSAHMIHDAHHPQEVFLSVESFESVRIKETGHILYLDFVENIGHDHLLWPNGLLLSQGDASEEELRDGRLGKTFHSAGVFLDPGSQQIPQQASPQQALEEKIMQRQAGDFAVSDAPEHYGPDEKKTRRFRVVAPDGSLV